MSTSKPIYSIAKEMGIETNKIVIACKILGISAKGSAKRLNNEEQDKILNYFQTGKNVSNEIVDLKDTVLEKATQKSEPKINEKEKSSFYFKNRLIG